MNNSNQMNDSMSDFIDAFCQILDHIQVGVIVFDEALNRHSGNKTANKIILKDSNLLDWDEIKEIFTEKLDGSSNIYKTIIRLDDVESLCWYTRFNICGSILNILILGDNIKSHANDILKANLPASLPPVKAKHRRCIRDPIISNPIKFSFADIIGESKKIRDLKKKARRIAQGDSTVLITGESGTGKELFAQAIHSDSLRKHAKFIRVNCGSVPETLLESELFGYEPGSFTGAEKEGKKGKFEIAHNGSLFMDEAGDMSLGMQAKILRVVQDCEFERIGGATTYEIDVRLIAATNKNLWELVQEGLFREDLYYRMDVVNLHISPLRERIEDIPLLVKHFIPSLRQRTRTRVEMASNEVMDSFCRYRWPGNVRELKNTLESMMNMETRSVLGGDLLPSKLLLNDEDQLRENLDRPAIEIPKATNLKEIEKAMIKQALYLKQGNKRQAAIYLNMPRSSFYNKLKKYEIYFSENS